MTRPMFTTTRAAALTVAMSAGDTTVNLDDGSTYPDPAVEGDYTVILGYGSSREEVCTVTAKPLTDVLTVTRAQDGTSATAKNVGDTVVHGATPRDWTDLVPRDGSRAMTGDLTLAGDPSSALHAATRQYVDSGRSRNRLHNGALAVYQRALSARTTDGFVFDRWKRVASGGTVGHGMANFALGDASGGIPESPVKYGYMTTSGQSAASDYAQFVQRMESVRTLSGRTVVLSFWARVLGGGPASIAVDMTQWFGTGGSPSSAVNTAFGKQALTGTFARYEFTATLPSISGKTLGSNGDDILQVSLWTSAGSDFNSRTGSLGIQNEQIDIWGLQLEVGSTATDFEQRTYAEELAICQRYYQRRTPGNAYSKYGIGVAANTTTGYCNVDHPVPFRKAPSSIESNLIAVYDGGSHHSVSVVLATGSPFTSSIQVTTGGTWVSGQGQALVMEADNSLSSYLAFDAEV